MKEQREDKLLESYRQGKSTLEEENILRERNREISDPEAEWFKFTARYRKEAPEGLEKRITESLGRNREGRRRLISFVSASAAIVVILISLTILKPWDSSRLSYNRKVALYQEALNMVGSAEPVITGKEIIYEDETITIYLETEEY